MAKIETKIAEKVLDLGDGLEIWKAHVDELIEQDLNARQMTGEMFDRLAATIGRDKRLESLPLVAQTDKGLEIVSGHHRVRAARKAGVSVVFAIVDVTGLSPDAIKAKQLAHNSLAGTDDPTLIARIYESIERADFKMEAFIDPNELNMKVATVPVGNVDLGLDYKTAMLTFIPYELKRFELAMETIMSQTPTNLDRYYMVELDLLAKWREAMRRIGVDYDIHSISTCVAKMADLSLAALGVELPSDEMVHFRDIFGVQMVPTEVADVLKLALAKMMKDGDVTKNTLSKALELWAADCLSGT